ncbi:flagellar hook assembly protein FlgD [Lysinibacillus louembei]|uniref:Basal-body rod modification protein FlgD n=1 Tax=Lysinibacillus louembei TaxID=1470088 RepID=A0ABZ0RWT0_9BACI|nr:flagellar hook assembly protein FlgD [Lysinibacillus louembei]WPK11950.1 flagellar hook assembly protein FlgD [Lysinibacillus louembei]
MTTTPTTNTASSKVTDDLYYSSYKAPVRETGNSALGKDAFLKLLITQLQNQDPTNPMNDREFIAQMAQFSSLEQMQNMTKAIEVLVESQQQTQLMSYTTFIGKEVKWHELTDKLDETGKPIAVEGAGTIVELKFVDGQPQFILDDGKTISAGNISSITGNGSLSGTGNPFAEASKLIGQTVRYEVDGQAIEALIEAITMKNGSIVYLLNNGTRLTKDQFEVVKESKDESVDKEESTNEGK